jgi:hypothetical protein
MKKTIIATIFILLASAATTSAFAQEEWFEVAEASGIGYDIAISREIPAAEAPRQGRLLMKLIPSLMINRASAATKPSTTCNNHYKGDEESATGNTIDKK